jgi:hypothetical protein
MAGKIDAMYDFHADKSCEAVSNFAETGWFNYLAKI